MFDSRDPVIDKVFNPLGATRSSRIEFNIGGLKDTGLYSFAMIAEFKVEGASFARYVIYSRSEDSEYVLEVFAGNNGQRETYLYRLADTVPFSEEFLEIAGQRYMTTPDGFEYGRCTMPDLEDRIDGTEGIARVYNIETGEIEKEFGVCLWDYSRETDGGTEFLSIEMSEETGMFKIFIGEQIEDIFYKFYQTSK